MAPLAPRIASDLVAIVATVGVLLGVSAVLLLAGYLVFAALSAENHPGAVALLDSIMTQWGERAPVDGRTINFLTGGAWEPHVPFALAAAAWFWLAVILYVLWCWLRNARQHIGVLIGVFAAVWLTTDLRWFRESTAHTQEAYRQFAGKNTEQRAVASVDSYLYFYARRIRARLEHESSRLYILHDSDWNDYLRLRLNYHLLPLNAYNFGRYPLPEYMRPGDRVLVILEVPELVFRRQDKKLVWAQGELSVVPEDFDQLATLYRYVGNPEGG